MNSHRLEEGKIVPSVGGVGNTQSTLQLNGLVEGLLCLDLCGTIAAEGGPGERLND